MERRIALFDMDDTLADWSGAMRRDLSRLASPDEPSNYPLHWCPGLPSHIVTRRDLIKQHPGW